MALIRFESDSDPIRNMLAVQEELSHFLRNPAYSLGLSGYGAYPPVNIFDEHDTLVIVAEVPGLDPGKIEISGAAHTLTISGERTRESTADNAAYHRQERPYGNFSRSIQLPEDLDVDKASARYDAGVLTVRVPKAEHARPRRITVQNA
jgi:HSP20 family protein